MDDISDVLCNWVIDFICIYKLGTHKFNHKILQMNIDNKVDTKVHVYYDL